MKDHVAPKAKYDPGVPLDKINATPHHRDGVVLESLNGAIPRTPTSLEGGVAWHMPPAKKKVLAPVVEICSAITKAGTPCRAKPIKGEGICIGHSRVKTDG